jgi:phytanoyl-CoA hydroxylase
MEDAALRQAKADYDRDGFAVVRGFLCGATLVEAQRRARHYIAVVAPSKPEAESIYLDRSRPETLITVMQMKEDEYWRSLPFREDSWLALARACGGTEAVQPSQVKTDAASGEQYAGGLQLLNKGPAVVDASVPTPPHQENWYFNLQGGEAPTVWVALDRVDEDNGCLRYVPGSHQRPLRPHVLSDLKGFSQTVEDWNEADVAAEVAVELDPGDAVVHHFGCLHRADANRATDGRGRLAIACVYQADSCTLEPVGYQRHLAVVKQHNRPAWVKMVLEWPEAPQVLRDEASLAQRL